MIMVFRQSRRVPDADVQRRTFVQPVGCFSVMLLLAIFGLLLSLLSVILLLVRV